MPLYSERSGLYFRVCQANWADPSDTAYAKAKGGRWNPPDEFGALYLNRTIDVAAANARALYAGSFYRPEDLTGAAELQLQEFDLAPAEVVDCVTAEGVAALGFPAEYPYGCDDHAPCQAVARAAYAAGSAGVATSCASECTPDANVGEELALFDTAMHLVTPRRRLRSAEWYPAAR